MDALVSRLEAALARLEAVAPALTPEKRLESVVARLENFLASSSSSAHAAAAPSGAAAAAAPAGAPAAAAVSAAAASAAAEVHAGVQAFDEAVAPYVARLKASAKSAGAQAEASVEALEAALAAERRVLQGVFACKKPAPEVLQKALAPLAEAMGKANKLTEGKRTNLYNHVKAVAESTSCLTWLAYTGKDCGLSLPGPHIDETWPAAEFYTNKILVENKNKEGGEPHIEFARALKELFTKGLREYVRKFHIQGPAWATSGADLEAFLSAPAAAPAAPARKGPPPPPPPGAPPPPPPPAAVAGGGGGGKAADMSKVFAELSKGEAVTSGLRKVTADMKTKNRADRSGAVPASVGAKTAEGSTPAPAAKPAAAIPPKFELQQGRKWVVENQVNNKEIVISETEPKQTVYIYGCKGSLIQVKGKVNNITLDKCSKTAVVFQDVVAACEIVNCTSVEIQCQGSVPCLAVDNTSGCQLYLSAASLAASITTAKSSEINVAVPGSTPDAELVEHALPEQFVSEYKDGAFVTTAVSHSGG